MIYKVSCEFYIKADSRDDVDEYIKNVAQNEFVSQHIDIDKVNVDESIEIYEDLTLESDIAGVITSSSLWNCGKDSHNALSELTIALKELIKNDRR